MTLAQPGATGAKGEKGDTGVTGATGAKGEKGDAGATGATGAKGEKGDAGATGATGAKGEKGDAGATGATGAKGEKGDAGATGATGAKGEKGDAGATGATGAKGEKGDAGDTTPKFLTKNLSTEELNWYKTNNIDLTEVDANGTPKYLIAKGQVDKKYHVYQTYKDTTYKSVQQVASGNNYLYTTNAAENQKNGKYSNFSWWRLCY